MLRTIILGCALLASICAFTMPYPGCTNQDACNFDPNATEDDGSCTYPGCIDTAACNYDPDAGCSGGECCFSNCIEINMTDGFGDGWNGNIWEIYDYTDFTVIASGTLASGAEGQQSACLTSGCYIFGINTIDGLYPEEVMWSLSGSGIEVAYSGGSEDFVFLQVGEGCGDFGCMDPAACNYTSTAIYDDGSCCLEQCLVIDQTDSFGDGWNNNTWEVFSYSSLSVVASGTLGSGSNGQDIACLAAGCYYFSINTEGGLYPTEIGWTISGTDDEPATGGYQDVVEFTIGGGGTDVGCLDPAACNYSELAICESGKCCYANCAVLVMTDVFGDSWNGGEMTLHRDGVLWYTLTHENGLSSEISLCLEDGCYELEVTGGSFPTEIGWTLTFPDDNHFLGGGAPFLEYLTINSIHGCRDNTACNFNASATCDDGSCTYPGCLDENACNYNADAACADVCDYACQGCTYTDALNFDPLATDENGTCVFECASDDSCPSDLDGDGSIASGDLLMLLSSFGTPCLP